MKIVKRTRALLENLRQKHCGNELESETKKHTGFISKTQDVLGASGNLGV